MVKIGTIAFSQGSLHTSSTSTFTQSLVAKWVQRRPCQGKLPVTPIGQTTFVNFAKAELGRKVWNSCSRHVESQQHRYSCVPALGYPSVGAHLCSWYAAAKLEVDYLAFPNEHL